MVALRHPETLAEIDTVSDPVLLLLYVRIGQTKLLDNRVIDIQSENGMEAA